ncbi:MAG: transcriptional regulator, TraR/DksA family protein [Thermodesulfobacteriota bacterium]|nr:transcriptional regulator, TraR/DksA family protein [Thermodesulfobacteriota bacterium]
MEVERLTVNECCLNDESYMDEAWLNYFKNKLINLKMSMVEKIYQNKEKIKSMRAVGADILDNSNAMVAIDHEIQSQERSQQLLKQINAALNRIEDGSFGYCRITGYPIGLKRMEALPYTALSMEALQQIDTLQ